MNGGSDSLQQRVGEWGAATFPNATDLSIVMHLAEEIDELTDGVAFISPSYERYLPAADQYQIDPAELADVGLMLLHLAHRHGVDLFDAMEAKFAVCRKRTWSDDGRGYARHMEVEP
jgi:NTP pyrophosphatase (non-canonical NTP hydrolase)